MAWWSVAGTSRANAAVRAPWLVPLPAWLRQLTSGSATWATVWRSASRSHAIQSAE